MIDLDDGIPGTMRNCAYVSADLTMVGDVPYWAVHAIDEDDGNRTSWIVHGHFQGNVFSILYDVWVPDAIQAIAGDASGHLWAITADGSLITNMPMQDRPEWEAMAVHPSLHDGATWYTHELVFECEGAATPEVAVCLCWSADELLIGTFSRRIYCWQGSAASLEFCSGAPEFSGGVNDILATSAGAIALGYGGTLLARARKGVWSAPQVPWSPEDAAFVNVVAGVVTHDGRMCAVVDGGWVVTGDTSAVTITHRVAGKPLGISTFQDDIYVATMEGLYQLSGAGHATLMRRNVALGKLIDAGCALVATDAAPADPARAGLHIWLRTRTTDRWSNPTLG